MTADIGGWRRGPGTKGETAGMRALLHKAQAERAECPRCRSGPGDPCTTKPGVPMRDGYHTARHQRWVTGW